jgi:O-antigen/teichoic acid export membrane protein
MPDLIREATSLFRKYRLDAARYTLSLLISQVHVLLLPFYTRQMPVKEIGVYELSFSAFGFLSIALALGINNLASVRMMKGKGSYDGVVKLALPFVVTSLPVCIFLSIPAIAHWLAAELYGDAERSDLFVVVLWTSFFTFFRYVVADILIISGRSAKYLLFDFLFLIFLIIGILTYHWLWTIDALGIFLANLLGMLPAFSFVVFKLFRLGWFGRLTQSLLSMDYMATLRVTIPLAMSGFTSWIVELSDRWLLLFFGTGTESIAYYGIAYKLAAIGPAFCSFLVNTLVIRHFYADMAAEGRVLTAVIGRYWRFTAAYVVGLGVLLLLTVLALETGGDRILGAAYRPAFALMPFLGIGLILRATLGLMTAPLLFLERTKALLALNFGAASVHVLINILLIPRLGTTGAVVSTIMAYLLSLVSLLIITRNIVLSKPEWRADDHS